MSLSAAVPLSDLRGQSPSAAALRSAAGVSTHRPDGEGSLQVHQDASMKIEGAKVFAV